MPPLGPRASYDLPSSYAPGWFSVSHSADAGENCARTVGDAGRMANCDKARMRNMSAQPVYLSRTRGSLAQGSSPTAFARMPILGDSGCTRCFGLIQPSSRMVRHHVDSDANNAPILRACTGATHSHQRQQRTQELPHHSQSTLQPRQLGAEFDIAALEAIR